ncbi:MAG TPA: hypothetical protein VKX25_20270 [Bryobacteraceae bacterium]|jgi:hypothetical protein|nr:hypothetical protein [Bryobacteraceae bacterium]
MWQQIWALAWAQFRITRNHLPRTTAGTVFSWFALALWYGLYAAGAVFVAITIPKTGIPELAKNLPVGLLVIFLFWQIIPLFTMSAGWSLELNKLQIYPIREDALFGLETILRITSAPEMLIVLAGVAIGLFRHSHVPAWSPFTLLLFIPLNLFLQLAIRDLILHSFERNRFRELFAIVVISVAILPQLLLRTGLGRRMLPHLMTAARFRFTPWKETAALSLAHGTLVDLALLVLWCVAAFVLARWIFTRSLKADDSFQPGATKIGPNARESSWADWPSRLWRDPFAVLVAKELRSLVRMPKFRVLFGMSCLLGIVVFVPAALNGHDATSGFMRQNLLPVVNLYGLLLLSDALLLNALGFDRGAAQAYFVTPIELSTVLKAKNLSAIFFVALQSTIIICVSAIARVPITRTSIVSGLLASSVVTVFLLIAGNYTSLAMPRPLDPKQTFKKQAGAKMQIWLFGCSLGLFALVGFAFLARYAFASDWALFGVLIFELMIGLFVYRLGLQSAIERGMRRREEIVQTLSRSGSPMSLG